MANSALDKEIRRLVRAEKRFLNKQAAHEDSRLDLFLAEKVPRKLEHTLNKAFAKAFSLIFSKGSSIIGRTFSMSKLIEEFEADTEQLEELGRGRDIRRFKHRAAGTGTFHTLTSAAAGTALGLAGAAVPDIVVFNVLLIRNIYKIAMRYGYDFDTEEEQKFILRIIAAAVTYGDDILSADKEINRIIKAGLSSDEKTVDELIDEASMALSRAQMYMKFLQKIPIVGAVGGASDFIYMEKISDYAALKYNRRFLMDQRRKEAAAGV